jgi:hypothetical protein
LNNPFLLRVIEENMLSPFLLSARCERGKSADTQKRRIRRGEEKEKKKK